MIKVIWNPTPFSKALILLEIAPMLLITPPVTKMYMHFIFDYSTRSFKSASTQVVKTTNKLLNEGIFFNSTRRSALLSLRGAALPHFLHMLFPTLLISSILSKLTIFNKVIMHVVNPPKFSITIVSKFSWVLQSSKRNWRQWLWKI